MGLVKYFKEVGRAVMGTKSRYAPGFSMLVGTTFDWLSNNKQWQLTQAYRNKIIYAVVNVVVGKDIEVPLIVSKIKSERGARKYLAKTRFTDSDVATGMLKVMQVKAMEELDTHPLIDLLENPNNHQTGIEMREHFWFNYHLSGDGYIWCEKPTIGRRTKQPIFLYSLPAQNVNPIKNMHDYQNPILRYDFTTWDGQVIPIEPSEIMHMSKWSPNDPSLGGFSPLNSVDKTVAINEANQEARGAAYVNGGTGTIFSSETVIHEGATYSLLSKEQVEGIRETIDRNWKGARNNRGMHVTNGNVKVDKFGDTLAELQLIEADKVDWKDACAAYGVSPILLGDSSASTESNVKAAYKALVTNKIITDLRKFDMKFRVFSRGWYEQDVIATHDITEFTELAPDLKLMFEVFGNAWYITGDEKRKIFNFDESGDENMTKFLVPSGLTPLDSLFDTDFDNIDNGKGRDYN